MHMLTYQDISSVQSTLIDGHHSLITEVSVQYAIRVLEFVMLLIIADTTFMIIGCLHRMTPLERSLLHDMLVLSFKDVKGGGN